jgi:DNA recombination protein RmuC
MVVASLILGLALGAAAAWLFARERARASVARVQAELDSVRASADERLAAVDEARSTFENVFKALSADALRSNSEAFLQLARTQLDHVRVQASGELEQRQKAVEQLVAPIRESLERVDGQVRSLEQARKEAYGALAQQVRTLAESQERLRLETGNLVTALRAPHVRGRWGEMQLKRVVEMAGMVPYCDFVEQETTRDADGRALRPDVVVRLAGGKHIVVDAKAPLHAYLDALEAQDDDVRRLKLAEHARQVREHIAKLGSKAYWRQFDNTPDFVVMFLPDETFFRAALEHDGALIEAGVEAGVVPASPTTLIGLLRVIAYGWQQETVAQSAREVSELGRELYERLSVLGRHMTKLGRGLDGAVAAYNETVGSLETRVLVTARKFEDHGIGGELPAVEPLERQARPLQAVELTQQLNIELMPPSDADAA